MVSNNIPQLIAEFLFQKCKIFPVILLLLQLDQSQGVNYGGRRRMASRIRNPWETDFKTHHLDGMGLGLRRFFQKRRPELESQEQSVQVEMLTGASITLQWTRRSASNHQTKNQLVRCRCQVNILLLVLLHIKMFHYFGIYIYIY